MYTASSVAEIQTTEIEIQKIDHEVEVVTDKELCRFQLALLAVESSARICLQ